LQGRRSLATTDPSERRPRRPEKVREWGSSERSESDRLLPGALFKDSNQDRRLQGRRSLGDDGPERTPAEKAGKSEGVVWIFDALTVLENHTRANWAPDSG